MRSVIAICLATATATSALAAPMANGEFKGAKGESGRATLHEGPKGVVLRLELKGFTPGWHAVHFHAVGDCSDAAFKKSGGHINHEKAVPHGLLNPAGPDMGDLPNVHVGADGSAAADLYSPFVSVRGADGRPALIDKDGSAIVIHASADDYMTQPIGGAGERVACAVIN